MKFPVKYINGNYQVTILNDGTKIRYTPDDILVPTRPETLDINISNYCENNCPWCYLDASIEGKHGNLNLELFNTIPPYTEVAINYAKHPNLINFLERMKTRKVITNLTINQLDFNKNWDKLLDWQIAGLFYGLGISITSTQLTKKIKYFDNVVAHTILGITSMHMYKRTSKRFNKVLILGYKNKGRGKQVVPSCKIDLPEIFNMFEVVSFDNLGIEQAKVKNIIDKEDWAKYFMGEEGSVSFYIDTVEAKFYESSTSDDEGTDVYNKSVKSMFKELKTHEYRKTT